MHDFEDAMNVFIGLVSAVLALSIPIVYIVTRSRRLQRTMELLHAERMAAIERGMDLPPTPLEALGDRLADAKQPRTALLPGLVWLFVGLAISVSIWAENGFHTSLMVGLIPAGIGLAYLVYYFIEERRIVGDAPAATNR